MKRELERPLEEYRRAFALRCVQSLTQSSVKRLLERYVSGTGHRYYDSVHWLDLGVAFQTGAAKKIAEKVLKRQAP